MVTCRGSGCRRNFTRGPDSRVDQNGYEMMTEGELIGPLPPERKRRAEDGRGRPLGPRTEPGVSDTAPSMLRSLLLWTIQPDIGRSPAPCGHGRRSAELRSTGALAPDGDEHLNEP